MMEKTKKFAMSPKAHFICLGLVVIGAITFLAGLHADPGRLWHSYLVNYFFWFAISLCGLFFVALCYITGSRWAVPLKRIPEAFTGFLPIAFLLLLVLLAGLSPLYEWTHVSEVAHDSILKGKLAYLNVPFFVIRNFVFFGVWIGAAFLFLKNSLRQDQTGAESLTHRNRKLAAPFLVFFGFSFTIFSFDWLMSLEPHWFSTIFGVYCFAGLFESGLAMMILFVIFLKRRGALAWISENHLHDLGKLMFAFCVFWAYIAFSQYMLIWYGNLPEEIPYMIRRTMGSWTPIALALLFGKFIIPFFMLLGRPAKRNENYLIFVSLWVLAAQWLDIYWLVFPLVGKPAFGWMELGLFAGFLGLFVLSVTWMLQRMPLLAAKDPWLEEGLNYHQ